MDRMFYAWELRRTSDEPGTYQTELAGASWDGKGDLWQVNLTC